QGTSASQRILVAVGTSPHGEALLRWTRRLAYALRADWDCLTVETGEEMSDKTLARLTRNLELARSLGARVSSITNLDIAGGIVGYARDINASFIVIGKSGLSSARGFLGVRRLSEDIMQRSGSIPVFAVQDRALREQVTRRISKRIDASPPAQFAAAVLAIGAVTLVNMLIAGYVGYWGAAIPYLATISILALFIGRGPVFLAALLSAALWDFVFISPRFTFRITNPADLLMLGLYFLLALTSGWFTQKLKSSERLLRSRERRLEALSGLASGLAGASSRSEILEVSSLALQRFFEAEVAILMRGPSGELNTEPEGGWQAIDDKTLSAARYCLENDRIAGHDTDTLPLVEWHFAPLQSGRGTLGVIGLRRAENRHWTGELDVFLATMLRTVALAIERELAIVDTTATTLAKESERLGKLLLDSVSHELRTPLTIIQGSATALANEETASNPTSRRLLLSEISEGASRLDSIVGNLLSMNRLEAGSLALHVSEVDQEELVSAALTQTSREVDRRRVVIIGSPSPEVLRCDAALIVQVLVNLVRNALRYGPAEGTITLRYGADPGGMPSFSVEDQGRGLPEKDLARIFEKFHRAAGAAPGGCGLGLAICKGIVEAHGGGIAARNLDGGGFAVGFTLPGKPHAPPSSALGDVDNFRSPL
ncbi:MAG: ATP-binding protein, partial [Spirochaetota bacterium]